MNKFKNKFTILLVLILSLVFKTNTMDNIQVSDYRIYKAKRQVENYESRRDKVRYLTAGTLSAGFVGALYYLWVNDDSSDLSKMKSSVKKLEEQLKNKQDKAGDNPKDEEAEKEKPVISYFEKTKSVLNSFAGYGFNWIVKPFVTGKIMQAMNFKIPKSLRFAEYVVETHTISWYVENKTSLQNVIKDIVNILNSEDKNLLELKTSFEQLVVQVEKTIAFMLYVENFLDPVNNLFEKNRLKFLIGKIKKLTNEMFLLDSAPKIRTNLKLLISNIESFISIEKEAGFEDPEPNEIFNILRALTQKNGKKS